MRWFGETALDQHVAHPAFQAVYTHAYVPAQNEKLDIEHPVPLIVAWNYTSERPSTLFRVL